MEFPKHIFRAYDIRGIFGKDLTPEVMLRLGLSLGTVLNGTGKVVVGRDVRTSGSALTTAISSGIVSTGCDVNDVGVAPIGMISFATEILKGDAGAAVEASHNPPDWNGLKLLTKGGFYSKELDEKVRKIFWDGNFVRAEWKNVGKIERVDVKNDYIKFIEKKIKIDKDLKVGIDCKYGSTSVVAPELFRVLGCKVFSINDRPDGTFPAGTPEPKPDNLGDIVKLVRKEKLDMGIAYDGDGDRLVIIDDKGNILPPELVAVFLMKHILKGKSGEKIIANVECSSIVDDVAKNFNCKVVRVRVGHFFILDALKRERGILGVEKSGHFSLPFLREFDDAILISAKIAELVSKLGVSLSEYLAGVPQYAFRRIAISCPDEKKFVVVDRLKEKLRERYKVDLTDGIKVMFDDGWFLIRPSNTESLIRLSVEALSLIHI